MYVSKNYENIFSWLNEINENCDQVSRILVGNKCEDPNCRIVLREDASKFASKMGIQLFETSAKENLNVEEMFRAITDLVLSSKKAQDQMRKEDSHISLGPVPKKKKNRPSCC